MANLIIWNSSLGPYLHHRTLGPYQLASWIRSHGYTVKVIEFSNEMPIDTLVKITERYIDADTLMIGVSSSFWEFPTQIQSNWQFTFPEWVQSARTALSATYPDIKWAVGGSRTYMCNIAGWERFDGAAENPVLARLDDLSKKLVTRPVFDIHDACNLYVNDDCITPNEVLPIELGRGCMFKCKFCSFKNIGKKIGTYTKSEECIRREILDHHTRWGTTRFFYVDETVNESVEKVRMLANIAESVPFKLEWFGYIRADLVWAFPETEELLERSGLRSAFFGIESFEPASAKLIGKGWSGKHAKDWLIGMRKKWDHKISWRFGMLIGVTGQTKQQLLDDANWLIDNDMHSWWFNHLWIERNHYDSEFSKNSQKYGYEFPDETKPYWWINRQNGWDFSSAAALAAELNEKSKTNWRYCAFDLGGLLSLGYDIDEVIWKHRSELDHNDMLDRKHKMVNSYIERNLT